MILSNVLMLSVEEYSLLSDDDKLKYCKCDHCGKYFYFEDAEPIYPNSYTLLGEHGTYSEEYRLYICTKCDNLDYKQLIENIKPRTYGRHTESHGESGKTWWVFPKKDGISKAVIMYYFDHKTEVSIEGYSINASYSPTGRRFEDPLYIKETEKSFVAYQWWHLDV